ncbi:MAG: alpha/beta hydrolase fold domain-containing protein [Verrucomicrobiota bacterium]
MLLFLIVALPLSAQQVPEKDRFKAWDRNSDGKLERSELPRKLQSNFVRVDEDGDGFITRAEHQRILARMRSPQGRPQRLLPDSIEVRRDLDYVGDGNPRQTLDLLVPKERAESQELLPLIVFVHGGGWRKGNKESGLRKLLPFVESGDYAGATINYRLTNESSWPTQIHDCKAAIRYLRGHAEKFGIDPEKIAVWGTSAGGHLVSMLGTSGGVKELEGDLGDFDDQSSAVSCVMNYFGPQNFNSMIDQQSKIDRSPDKGYPEALLLGGSVQERGGLAKQASPVTWVSSDDPPFLTAHGTKDPVVPFAQGEEIHTALEKAGVESELVRVEGAGHGFASKGVDTRVKAFLRKHLHGK